jgi:hypothetical protein
LTGRLPIRRWSRCRYRTGVVEARQSAEKLPVAQFALGLLVGADLVTPAEAKRIRARIEKRTSGGGPMTLVPGADRPRLAFESDRDSPATSRKRAVQSKPNEISSKRTVDWSLFATLTVSVFIAVVGYLVKYFSDVDLEQRKGQLDRVNRQLSELYGPLFALARTGTEAFEALLMTRSDGADFQERPPTEEEAAEFRRWMIHVLMPLNRRLMELIVTKADLLEENEMPDVLLHVAAHVSSYEAVLNAWESSDYKHLWAVLPFPGADFRQYTSESYVRLRRARESFSNA